jgi:VanZ family protein
MSGPAPARLSTRFLAGAIAYAAIIFAVSQIPGREIARLGIDLWDKGLHAAEYAVLGALLAAWQLARPPRRAGTPWRRVAAAIGIAIAYGALDEIHQMFVPGRQSSLLDVAADAFGASLGAIAAAVVARLLSRSRSRTTS